MPVLVIMKWPGVSKEQYESVRKASAFETDQPKGGLLHVAAFSDDAMHITDVWESAEVYNDFIATKITPAAAAAGMTGQPEVQILPTHNIFNSGVDRK